MTVLGQLAESLVSLREQPLPATLRQRLAIHVLDTVGSWIAGHATEEGIKLASTKLAPAQRIALLGSGPLDRITLGIATVRLTEIDDIHMPSCTTPASVVVPTCLMMTASSANPGTETFARALCAGYELMTRFGAAIDGAEIVYRLIWPTYFAAAMVSAGVAAQILGLDATKTTNALAIALSLTSGALGTPIGQSPRWLLLGLAARDGCAAALMASEGYAGDPSLLDADWLLRTHGISCDVATLLSDPWDGNAIKSVSLKPYCSAKQCVAAIEAFRNLLDEGVTTDEIVMLRVRVPPVYAAMIGHRHAADGRIRRITSVAYNLALAGRRFEELRNISRINLTADPQIAALMKRVEVYPDNELAEQYPARWPARVDAVLQSGRSVSNLVLDAPGDPARPFGTTEALEKYHALTDSIVGLNRSHELADACLASTENIEALETLWAWMDT